MAKGTKVSKHISIWHSFIWLLKQCKIGRCKDRSYRSEKRNSHIVKNKIVDQNYIQKTKDIGLEEKPKEQVESCIKIEHHCLPRRD
jgi:hypothetical protein